jgi:aspartyl-tRNA(Asn)/glutamyl-tRNA(Gln) amidotransferase subunit B
MKYAPVIGLESHAELATETKMFCSCRVVDTTQAAPNTTVCPVCAGMPGTLPVVNQKAVEYGIKVALALECEIQRTSIFARKNYFYPDLPKGYQISQYEYPLAVRGRMVVDTSEGEHVVRVTRVHLEEDTGKLTHIHNNGEDYSLVDLNRAGVPLLEIVSEPDMHSIEDVRGYSTNLRTIVRELGVNSGDMEKGVIRFEANVSLRPAGSQQLGTRVEIKNLNSFRAMERAILFEVERQTHLLDAGEAVLQETMGWDEASQTTHSQRSKEEAHDYRYFPEPDLPPLVVEPEWVEKIRAGLPELPRAKAKRFSQAYDLAPVEAMLLVSERETAIFFEETIRHLRTVPARTAYAWLTGEVFAWMRQTGEPFTGLKITPEMLADLLESVQGGVINQNTGKAVLAEMLQSGQPAEEIIQRNGLAQVSDSEFISSLIRKVLMEHPDELLSYRSGKISLANWFFGQVMKAAGGKANPAVLRKELEKQLQTNSAQI